MNGKRHNPLAGLALLILGAAVLGSLAGPWAFMGMQHLAAAGALPHRLSVFTFERVTSRCVMIAGALLLIPAFRVAGLGGNLRKALAPTPERWRALGVAMALGCASMLVIYVGGWLIGAYRVDPDIRAGSVVAGSLFFIIGAVLVGLLEETFFRGFVFGALRSRWSFVPAAVVASLFFSSIHFFRPDAPGTVTEVSWLSGFELAPYLFVKFQFASDWSFAVTLVLMGLTLCVLYERQGHLYTAMGLHAGWVWAMRVGSVVFDRNRDFLQLWFSRSDLISKGVLAMVVIAAFLVYACRKPRVEVV